MEKNIKDYLPFYLGCEGQLTTKRTYGSPKRTNQVLTAELLDRILKLPTVLAFKPILRLLSDMNLEEFNYSKNYNYSLLEDDIFGAIEHWADLMPYLISKHFDLFGLIESGLAIDKDTIK
jgi:hypothetical protein